MRSCANSDTSKSVRCKRALQSARSRLVRCTGCTPPGEHLADKAVWLTTPNTCTSANALQSQSYMHERPRQMWPNSLICFSAIILPEHACSVPGHLAACMCAPIHAADQLTSDDEHLPTLQRTAARDIKHVCMIRPQPAVRTTDSCRCIMQTNLSPAGTAATAAGTAVTAGLQPRTQVHVCFQIASWAHTHNMCMQEPGA
jgi:hypothetical protein